MTFNIYKHFRKDYHSADYRKAYEGVCGRLGARLIEREELERQKADHWKRIEAARYGKRERKLGFEAYAAEKDAHLVCEQKINRLTFMIDMDLEILARMRKPKRRKTVLVDGIRTKLEFAR